MGESIRQKVIDLRDARNFAAARVAATQMLEIAPDIPGGQSLLRELMLAYPIVRVGVFEQSNRFDATEIANWPVRRAGSLVSTPLFEFRNTGPEGGAYRFSLGSFTHSDDRTELELRIQDVTRPGVPSAYDCPNGCSDARKPTAASIAPLGPLFQTSDRQRSRNADRQTAASPCLATCHVAMARQRTE